MLLGFELTLNFCLVLNPNVDLPVHNTESTCAHLFARVIYCQLILLTLPNMYKSQNLALCAHALSSHSNPIKLSPNSCSIDIMRIISHLHPLNMLYCLRKDLNTGIVVFTLYIASTLDRKDDLRLYQNSSTTDSALHIGGLRKEPWSSYLHCVYYLNKLLGSLELSSGT